MVGFWFDDFVDCTCFLFFFFKQKTAYEMRISDWSSDVCSSDLAVAKKHGAMVLVDEAHGMGFFGEHGRGVFEEAGVADQVDFVVCTFSKSVGTVGGFCVSNHPKFEVLRLVCRPYV